MLPCGGVLSLQDIAASSLHRTIGLRTVLPLLSWAKQHPALLDATGHRCKRFIINTFDALVDVEGADAVFEALDDPELFAQLVAESEDRRRRIRALRTPGRVLNRPASSTSSPQSGSEGPGADLAEWLDSLFISGPAHGSGALNTACTPQSTGGGAQAAAQQQLGFDSADLASGAGRSGSGAGVCGPVQTPSSNGAGGGVIVGGSGGSKARDRGNTSAISSTPAVNNHHAQYPYSSLVADVEWPPDVDPAHRDWHLSEADFQEVFGVSRGAFEKLPPWKRLQLKQAKKLF